MRIFKCDVCGETEQYESNLNKLQTMYQMENIQDVCSKCYRRVSDYVTTIHGAQNKALALEVKDYIKTLAGGK